MSIEEILRECAVSAYWCSEDTGDYGMVFVEREPWFIGLVERVKSPKEVSDAQTTD